MSRAELPPISPDQEIILRELVEQANELLETGAQESTDRAFNLGCSIGLLPTALIILASFVLSKGSWIVAALSTLLASIALLGFASLAANIARSNTLNNLYHQQILPKIEQTLKQLEIDRPNFDRFTLQYLPKEALLNNYLSTPEGSEHI